VEVNSRVTKRNYIVCSRYNCRKCSDVVLGRPVPDDCEYEILHALELDQEVKWQGRRTGKTHFLVDLAIRLSQRFTIYYVVNNQGMVKHAKWMISGKLGVRKMPDTIKLLSKGQIQQGGIRGFPSGLVILDEVRPGEVEEHIVPIECFPLVAARWT